MSSPPPDGIPLALPAPPAANPRRLPLPCWSQDETVALIDSYRDKWYALRRGNLKATHWQEVADTVSRLCPSAFPPKTPVQCRHKMEKLRKRYRTEIHRARSLPLSSSSSSSWIHFHRMDSMENPPLFNSDTEAADYHPTTNGSNRNIKIKIPYAVSIAEPPLTTKNCKVGKKRDREPIEEMAAAVKMLGDGFMRTEKMKMEMMREIETTRMEMEMKRTMMIIDSQQRIVEALANAFKRSP